MQKSRIYDKVSLVGMSEIDLEIYLNSIFDFLSHSKDTINLLQFHSYLNFPFTMSSRLYEIFTDYETKLMSKEIFTRSLICFFIGNAVDRIKILFRFLDTDGDEIVHIEDVKFFFRYIRVFLELRQKQIEKKIIFDLFSTTDVIGEDDFISYLTKKNSDIFYIFYYFFFKDSPISQEELVYFNNSNFSGTESRNKNKLLSISSVALSYLTNEPVDAIVSDSDDDLDALNSFESDIEKITVTRSGSFSNELKNFKNNQDFRTNTIMISKKINDHENILGWKGSEDIIKEEQEGPQKFEEENKLNFTNIPQHSYFKPVRFQASDNNLPTFNKLSKLFQQNNKEEEEIWECYFCDLSTKGEITPVQVLLKNNFCVIYKKKKFHGLILLRNKTFLSTGSQKVVIIEEQMYYSITLQFQFGEYRDVTILFKDSNKFKKFASEITRILKKKVPSEIYRHREEVQKEKLSIKVGENSKTKERVIIKTVPKKYGYDEMVNQMQYLEICRFLFHLNNMKRITHDVKIIRFKEFYENCNNYFLVSEYIKGMSLVQYLQDKATKDSLTIYSDENYFIPEKISSQILSDIITTIRFLHKYGIVHRTINLPNFLIDIERSGQCTTTLVNFKEGKIFLPCEKTKQLVKTNKFSSPEISQGFLYNKKTDIFSIGAVAFFLMYKDFVVCDKKIIKRKSSSEEEEKNWDVIFETNVNNGLNKILKSFLNEDESKRPDLKYYHL